MNKRDSEMAIHLFFLCFFAHDNNADVNHPCTNNNVSVIANADLHVYHPCTDSNVIANADLQ